MGHFVVRDETVAAAFEYLREAARPAAIARADRERREDLVKAVKAQGFLAATGTVAEREAKAIDSDSYVAALEGYYAAVELDEEFRNMRANAELTIEAWRSTNANRRADQRREPRDSWEPA